MWFIGCSRWWEKEAGKGKHFFQRLKEDIDPILLGKLFNRESVSHLNQFYTFKIFMLLINI